MRTDASRRPGLGRSGPRPWMIANCYGSSYRTTDAPTPRLQPRQLVNAAQTHLERTVRTRFGGFEWRVDCQWRASALSAARDESVHAPTLLSSQVPVQLPTCASTPHRSRLAVPQASRPSSVITADADVGRLRLSRPVQPSLSTSALQLHDRPKSNTRSSARLAMRQMRLLPATRRSDQK